MSDRFCITPKFHRPSTRTTLIAAFVGLSLGTNYTLTGLPNVKLMDTFDFVATYLFGLSIGLPVVVLTRTIYALVNPWGAASGWLVGMLVAGDSLYALWGYAARRMRLFEKQEGLIHRSLSLGLIGFFSALGFDLITNFGSGLVAVSGPDLPTYLSRALFWGLVTMNFPLPMGILHEASDFLFFSTVAPASIMLLKRSLALPPSPAKPTIHREG